MAEITTVEQLRGIIPDYGPRGAAKIQDRLCDQGIRFLKRSPFMMMATRGDYGLEVSQKGGEPGFARIVDERTLQFPEYVGNHLAIGLQNILADPQVGLAFLRPATDEVLRISGLATLHDDAGLCEDMAADGKPAKLIIRVSIDRAAFHCVRSARRARLWDPESWDEPTRISFGRIYADALQDQSLRETFDALTEESDSTLY